MFYETPAEFAERNNPEKAGAYWGAWSNYSKAIAEAGIMRGGAGLQTPDMATVVSLKNGKRHVQDEPYAYLAHHFGHGCGYWRCGYAGGARFRASADYP